MDLPINYNDATWKVRKEVREAYIVLQEGNCFHCKGRLDEDPPKHILDLRINWTLFPTGIEFLHHPIHLQHNHESGMTEGAVHAYCNAVMWQYHGK